MKNENEKKGLFARFKENNKKSSCCCDFEIEEVPEANKEDEDRSEKPEEDGGCGCGCDCDCDCKQVLISVILILKKETIDCLCIDPELTDLL